MGGLFEFESRFGEEIRWCSRDTLIGSIFELKKGAEVSKKLLEERACVFVEKGSIELEYSIPSLGRKIIRLSEGDSFYFPQTTEFRIKVLHKIKMIYVEVKTQEIME